MQPGPFAPPPPPVVGERMVRPSKWWFVVAGLVAIAGIVAAVAILVVGVGGYIDDIEDFDRALLPATLDVEITETGGYSIYHEYDGAYDGRLSSAPEVAVTDPSGAAVALGHYDTTVTYSAGGHEGRGIYTFDADVPGTYAVNASGTPGTGIAVGRGIGAGLVTTVGGAILAGLAGVLAGGVMAIVVGVRRSRSRRTMTAPPVVGGWGPPPPPAWGGTGRGGAPLPPPPAHPGPPRTPPQPPPPPPPPGQSSPGPWDGRTGPPSGRPGPSFATGVIAPAVGWSGAGDGRPGPLSGRSGPSFTTGVMAPAGGCSGAWDGRPGPAAAAGRGVPCAVDVAGTPAGRPVSTASGRTGAGPAVDPPSLRDPADWTRSDLPLPWSPRR